MPHVLGPNPYNQDRPKGPCNSFFTDSAPGYKAKQVKPATSLPGKNTVSVGDPGEPHSVEQLLLSDVTCLLDMWPALRGGKTGTLGLYPLLPQPVASSVKCVHNLLRWVCQCGFLISCHFSLILSHREAGSNLRLKTA